MYGVMFHLFDGKIIVHKDIRDVNDEILSFKMLLYAIFTHLRTHIMVIELQCLLFCT